jgi:hypothetical protein
VGATMEFVSYLKRKKSGLMFIVVISLWGHISDTVRSYNKGTE